MSYTESFDDRAPVQLFNITTDEGVELSFTEIQFGQYENPNVTVDTAARFATHEIIGGKTVRQKIGEDPVEVGISGVCNEEISGKIDELRKAKLVTVASGRLRNGIRCQVASTSTEPLEDGGAADMDTGEFLYNYNINLVGVE